MYVYKYILGGGHSGAKEAHHTDDVLATDRAFVQHFAARRARGHVAAFQHHALDGRIHADLAQVIGGQLIDGCQQTTRKQRSLGHKYLNLRCHKLPGQVMRSFHSRLTRSSSSFFSQQPLKSTRFSSRISFSCFTFKSSRSELRIGARLVVKHCNSRNAFHYSHVLDVGQIEELLRITATVRRLIGTVHMNAVVIAETEIILVHVVHVVH